VIFELRNNTARQRARVGLLRLMITPERVLAADVRKILDLTWGRAATLVEGYADPIGVPGAAVSTYSASLEWSLLTHYKRVAMIFSDLAWRSVGVKSALEGEFWRSQDMWAKTQAAKKVTKIDNTTRTRINRALRKGLDAGETTAGVAKRLRETGKFDRARATLIARTETHQASQYAVDQSMKVTKIPMDRIWTSAGDARTRPAHRSANRQRRPMGEPFLVGGELLMFPGDPMGSAKNVIRCRCVLMYARAMQPKKPDTTKPPVAPPPIELPPPVSVLSPVKPVMKPRKPRMPKPVKRPPAVEMRDARTLEEAKKQGEKLGLGDVHIEGYEQADAIGLLNRTNKHVFDVLDRHPELKKRLDDYPLNDFYVSKGAVLPVGVSGADRGGKLHGLYTSRYRSVHIAGTREMENSLFVGKNTWTCGADYFSTLRHELGHHMHSALDKTDVRNWLILVKRKNSPVLDIDRIKGAVSRYAATNEKEAFAECFSAWTSPLYGEEYRGLLPKDIEEFMKKLFGKAAK